MKELSSLLSPKVSAVICGLLLFCMFALESLAQSSTGNPTLSHTPPYGTDLPFPGKLMSLEAKLLNTKQTNRKLRVLIVRDGRLLDLSTDGALLNERDIPTYKFTIYSPLAEISYQFILYNPDGTVTTSRRYSVRRDCLPNVELTGVKPDSELSADEKIAALAHQSRGLDRDLEAYERALGLLEELRTIIKE
jgi:hypothetical protein